MRPLAPLLRFLVLGLLLGAPGLAHAQLSEADRKAAARSAYTEGVKLQEDGKPAEALARFEAAEKLYDAPTHLLRIAQCQAATGKQVEAAETYEVLIHKNLGANPPEAFTDAQKKGESELKDLRARIPTLRLSVKPDPQTLKNLQVTINGAPVPNELLSIARPVNPGTYKINASATGYKLAAPVDITLAEREQKATELQLVPGQGPAVVVTPLPPSGSTGPAPGPAPVPPPYTGANPPPGAYPPPGQGGQPVEGPAQPAAKPGSSSLGLLLGVHLGALVPGGGAVGGTTTTAGTTSQATNMSDVTATGGGGGFDASFRFARMLFVGGTFDYASLGSPDNRTLSTSATTVSTSSYSSHTSFIGLVLGIVPNIDRTSFIGSVGFGRRSFTASGTTTLNTTSVNFDSTLSGGEFAVDVGIAIPAGPIRIIPKAAVNVGAFTSQSTKANNVSTEGSIDNTATHTFIFVGIAGLWNVDLGKK